MVKTRTKDYKPRRCCAFYGRCEHMFRSTSKIRKPKPQASTPLAMSRLGRHSLFPPPPTPDDQRFLTATRPPLMVDEAIKAGEVYIATDLKTTSPPKTEASAVYPAETVQVQSSTGLTAPLMAQVSNPLSLSRDDLQQQYQLQEKHVRRDLERTPEPDVDWVKIGYLNATNVEAVDQWVWRKTVANVKASDKAKGFGGGKYIVEEPEGVWDAAKGPPDDIDHSKVHFDRGEEDEEYESSEGDEETEDTIPVDYSVGVKVAAKQKHARGMWGRSDGAMR